MPQTNAQYGKSMGIVFNNFFQITRVIGCSRARGKDDTLVFKRRNFGKRCSISKNLTQNTRLSKIVNQVVAKRIEVINKK